MVDVALPQIRKNSNIEKFKKNPHTKINKFGELNPDKTFYVIRINYGGGIFSILLYVLGQIRIAEKMNAIPVVDMKNFSTKYNELNKVNNEMNNNNNNSNNNNKFIVQKQ